MAIYRRSFQIRQREDAKSLSNKDFFKKELARRYKNSGRLAVTKASTLDYEIVSISTSYLQLYQLCLWCNGVAHDQQQEL